MGKRHFVLAAIYTPGACSL